MIHAVLLWADKNVYQRNPLNDEKVDVKNSQSRMKFSTFFSFLGSE